MTLKKIRLYRAIRKFAENEIPLTPEMLSALEEMDIKNAVIGDVDGTYSKAIVPVGKYGIKEIIATFCDNIFNPSVIAVKEVKFIEE